jgi:hypothetical protein
MQNFDHNIDFWEKRQFCSPKIVENCRKLWSDIDPRSEINPKKCSQNMYIGLTVDEMVWEILPSHIQNLP